MTVANRAGGGRGQEAMMDDRTNHSNLGLIMVLAGFVSSCVLRPLGAETPTVFGEATTLNRLAGMTATPRESTSTAIPPSAEGLPPIFMTVGTTQFDSGWSELWVWEEGVAERLLALDPLYADSTEIPEDVRNEIRSRIPEGELARTPLGAWIGTPVIVPGTGDLLLIVSWDWLESPFDGPPIGFSRWYRFDLLTRQVDLMSGPEVPAGRSMDWSPSEQRFVFAVDRTDAEGFHIGEIWSVDPSNLAFELIAEGEQAVWTGNGEVIALTRHTAGRGGEICFILLPSGTGRCPIVGWASISDLAWDGRSHRLLFAGYESAVSTARRLFEIVPNTDEVSRVRVRGPWQDLWSPRASPSGRWLATNARRESAEVEQLLLLDPSGEVAMEVALARDTREQWQWDREGMAILVHQIDAPRAFDDFVVIFPDTATQLSLGVPAEIQQAHIGEFFIIGGTAW